MTTETGQNQGWGMYNRTSKAVEELRKKVENLKLKQQQGFKSSKETGKIYQEIQAMVEALDCQIATLSDLKNERRFEYIGELINRCSEFSKNNSLFGHRRSFSETQPKKDKKDQIILIIKNYKKLKEATEKLATSLPILDYLFTKNLEID